MIALSSKGHMRLLTLLLLLTLQLPATATATASAPAGTSPSLVAPADTGDEQTPEAILAAGNRAYQEGDYEGAANHYKALLERGFENGYLLYNLGNAYYKLGDLGHAILAYERAHRLLPRYQDLDENLAYLKVLKRDKDPDAGAPRYLLVARKLVHGVTLAEISWAALATWLLLAAILLARILLRRDAQARPALRVATWVVGLLLVGALCHTFYLARNLSRPVAIVIAEEVAVRSGPSEEDITEFKLHAGTKVLLERGAEGWSRIALSEELRGWCPSDAIEKI